MIPICLSSLPRYLLTSGVPASLDLRLARGAGPEIEGPEVVALDRTDVACLTWRLGASLAASLTAVGCVGPAWKF